MKRYCQYTQIKLSTLLILYMCVSTQQYKLRNQSQSISVIFFIILKSLWPLFKSIKKILQNKIYLNNGLLASLSIQLQL